jgi:hypothetical protein
MPLRQQPDGWRVGWQAHHVVLEPLPGKRVISGYACGKKHDNPRDLIS